MGLQYFHNCSSLEKEPNQQIQTLWKPGSEQRFEGISAIYTSHSPWAEILLSTETNESPSESGTRQHFIAPTTLCTRLLFSRIAWRPSNPRLF